MVMNRNTVEKTLLTIAIPTYNHSDYLRFMFHNLEMQGCDATLYVLDSSTSSDTKELCEHIHNLRIESYHFEKTCTAEEKCFFAMRKYKTPYLWICGDGLIPEIHTVCCEIIDESIDLLHLVNTDARDTRQYYSRRKLPYYIKYSDVALFFRDFFWTATFMGATIINRRLSNTILQKVGEDKYKGTGFDIICSVLDALSHEKGNIVAKGMHYYIPNPLKKEAIWMNSKAVFEIWSRQMPQAVRKLPSIFAPFYDAVIKNTAVNNNYLSFRGLIRWRSKNIYTMKIEKEYEGDLDFVSNVPRILRKLIALMPVCLCRCIFIPISIRNSLKREKIRKIMKGCEEI